MKSWRHEFFRQSSAWKFKYLRRKYSGSAKKIINTAKFVRYFELIEIYRYIYIDISFVEEKSDSGWNSQAVAFVFGNNQ